jgi:hypothetical protein
MSAMPQIEQDRAGMPFPGLSRDVTWSVQSNASSNQKQTQGQAATSTLRGQIETLGILPLPEQDFTVSRIGNEVVIKNQPADPWPLIALYLDKAPSSRVYEVKDILIRPNGNTVDAFLLGTRIAFSLFSAGKLFLRLNQEQYAIGPLAPLSELDKTTLYAHAQIIRKLKYIEKVFETSFSIPEEVSWQDELDIEFIFRGITEGEFTIRGGDITVFQVPLSPTDLTKPPFDGPGPFSDQSGPEVYLLGKRLSVDMVTVELEKAELANPRMVEPIRNGSLQAVDLHFAVLDNQITYCFENYMQLSPTERLEKLNQFKQELAREEPEELVDLIDEPLQGDVTPEEANQIAMGWTLYNDLPDRYCPQDPILDEATGCWRVPIYLVYTNGEGGPVGELSIDLKTGKIIEHTPIKELRSRGLALAKRLLNAQ